jgi:hypothetical protein
MVAEFIAVLRDISLFVPEDRNFSLGLMGEEGVVVAAIKCREAEVPNESGTRTQRSRGVWNSILPFSYFRAEKNSHREFGSSAFFM